MKRPLLSICIPTYGRPECVQKALENLANAVKAAGEQENVELCISESTRTDVKLERLQKSGISIKYNHNRENVGAERNTLMAMDLASGEYIQLSTDKELFSREGIQRTMHALRKNPDCVTIGSGCKTLEEFFVPSRLEELWLAGLIWTIARRENYRRLRDLAERSFGLLLPQTPIFIAALAGSRNTIAIKEDCRGEPKQLVPKRQTYDLPSTAVKIFHANFWECVKICATAGFVTERRLQHLARGMAEFSVRNMTRIRLHIPKEMAEEECERMRQHTETLANDLPLEEERAYRLCRAVILSRSIPWHLGYRAYLALNPERRDYHKFHLSKKTNTVNVEEYNKEKEYREFEKAAKGETW